ncbi:hypothetical protein [Caulobacter hibisci]|uniref:Uncharacterized protein n=1 Tax=Caulobacter hibisci TaxID=2035993 RepID=A0ABS0T3I3_9CAUL|nr:hypothetical protein [Caulobacter hibisci]MBI1686447.1 hypothetical protein [Caulobacter hibisci]
MSIEKIILGLPEKSAADRKAMRDNAIRLADTGSEAQRAQAQQLLAALDGREEDERKTLFARLKDAPVGQRVLEAFKAVPMTENERKTIQALLDNPGSTSTELSRACGHDSMIWQMHFGNLCKDRQDRLWPAEIAEHRDAPFFSGILADIDEKNRFTMKPEVAEAFAVLGLRGRKRVST